MSSRGGNRNSNNVSIIDLINPTKGFLLLILKLRLKQKLYKKLGNLIIVAPKVFINKY